MTGTRPLLLGYIRAAALTTERELVQTTSDLATFAEVEGYSLGTVIIEWADQASAALDALLAEWRRPGASALVVPGPMLLACAPCRPS